MRIYRISASIGKISFTRSIKAETYQDARNKFMLENNANSGYLTFTNSNLEIDRITRGIKV